MLNRKVQHHDNEKQQIWCYMVEGQSNPCGCGSNVYHMEYDGEDVYGVCNSCGKDIYAIDEDYRNELLKKGIWKDKYIKRV